MEDGLNVKHGTRCDPARRIVFEELGQLLDNWKTHKELKEDVGETYDGTAVKSSLSAPVQLQLPNTDGF